METEFWQDKWKKNQIGFHQPSVNQYLPTYWHHLDLTANSRIFVPLCGKTLDMLWLSEQGHSVLGVEISALAISRFFNENALVPQSYRQGSFERWQAEKISILHGDFFQLGVTDIEGVNGIFDRAALIALPPELRQQYAQHLQHIFLEMPNMLLITLEYDQNKMAGPPFSVTEQDIRHLYQQKYTINLLFEQDVLHENGRFQASGISWLLEKVYLLSAH